MWLPEDLLVPQATTCDLLQCHFGGECQEHAGSAICVCTNHCLPVRLQILFIYLLTEAILMLSRMTTTEGDMSPRSLPKSTSFFYSRNPSSLYSLTLSLHLHFDLPRPLFYCTWTFFHSFSCSFGPQTSQNITFNSFKLLILFLYVNIRYNTTITATVTMWHI